MPSDAPGVSSRQPFRTARSRAHGISLGMRVALVTMSAVVLAVLVAAAVSYPLARDAARQETSANLDQLADATAAALERLPPGSPEAIPPRLAALLRAEDITAYYVPPGKPVPDLLTRPDVSALIAGQSAQGERETKDGTVLFSARLVSSGAVLVLSQPLEVTGALALKVLTRFSFALAAGVAIAAIFGLLLARRLTRPLREAARAAKRLSEGDRNVELEVSGPREIAELAEALNELRYALAVSEGRQRDFLLSVSHELRTPLTAIRGYAEAIADGVVDPADIPSTGATMQAEADRLDLLVADLLELARLDAVDVPISPVDVDFREIGREAASVWTHRCEAAGLTLRTELPDDPVPGVTDPTRVRQIIDNLCANALRVTPSGSVMVIAVRPLDEKRVELEVRDGGPGLTPEDCEVAFEPAELYSRYRGLRKVGTGVGLALVGRLATRLGGSAEAGSAPEGGARFTIRIARNIED